MSCFRMLRPGDSFDTRWEKQAARLVFFPDFCRHLHIDFAGENCRKGISKLESLFYGITFKPLTYFLWIFMNVPSWRGKPIFDHQICEAPICQGRDFAAHRHLALQMVLLSAALSRRWAPKRSLCMEWNGTPLNGLSKYGWSGGIVHFAEKRQFFPGMLRCLQKKTGKNRSDGETRGHNGRKGPRLYTRSGASSVHAAKGLVCTRGMGLLYVPVCSYSCVFCVLHVCRLSCTGLQQLYCGIKVIVVGSVVHGSSCCFCLSFFAWHRHGFAVCISLFLQLCILCAPCAQVVLYRSWAVVLRVKSYSSWFCSTC